MIIRHVASGTLLILGLGCGGKSASEKPDDLAKNDPAVPADPAKPAEPAEPELTCDGAARGLAAFFGTHANADGQTKFGSIFDYAERQHWVAFSDDPTFVNRTPEEQAVYTRRFGQYCGEDGWSAEVIACFAGLPRQATAALEGESEPLLRDLALRNVVEACYDQLTNEQQVLLGAGVQSDEMRAKMLELRDQAGK